MTTDQRIKLAITLARMQALEEDLNLLVARIQEQISDFQELLQEEYADPTPRKIREVFIDRYDD